MKKVLFILISLFALYGCGRLEITDLNKVQEEAQSYEFYYVDFSNWVDRGGWSVKLHIKTGGNQMSFYGRDYDLYEAWQEALTEYLRYKRCAEEIKSE